MANLQPSKLPDGVSVEAKSDDCVMYRLPREKMLFVWCFLAIAAAIAVLVGAAVLNLMPLHQGKAIGTGVAALGFGVLGLFVRESIDLRKRQIAANMHLGPFVFPRRFKLETATQLEVTPVPSEKKKANEDNFRVSIEGQRLTGGYPRAWCEALRADIVARWTQLNRAG